MVFEIDKRLIQGLLDNQLVALCNELIIAEADRLKISRSNIDTNLEIKAPDDGIDCYVRNIYIPEGINSSDWLPLGNSAWQYKSGKCPSAGELVKREFTKPGVKHTFEKGETYCFVTCDYLSHGKKDQIRDKLITIQKKILGKGGKNHKVEPIVYDGNNLATWAQNHLPIASVHFNIPFGDWRLYRQWNAPERFRNDFVPDDQRTSLIKGIQDVVHNGGKFFGIVGRAGMGKTRLVMEALSSPDLQQHVFYLEDGSKIPDQFFTYLEQTPNGFLVLVLDEVTTSGMDHLRDISVSLPNSYTIIAIGPVENEYKSSRQFYLGGLELEQLAKIVGQFAPHLPEDVRRAIAGRCGGSPKLVQVIGEAIAKSPPDAALTWPQIEQDFDVVQFLEKRLFPVDHTSAESTLMRGISLFTRLGWYHELAADGKYVIKYLNISEPQASLALISLIKRGVVTKRGRYVYPTPDILANFLARTTISYILGGKLEEFYDGLSLDSQKAFAERIAQLSEDPTTRDVVKSFLEKEGFFSKLDEFAEPGKAELLWRLSLAFPGVLLTRLDKLIRSVSLEQLAEFKSGRREVVWALESLAWWREWFPVSSQLLLLLALTENESFANNATGVWINLFQVVLSGTELPYDERFPYLEEVLVNPDPQQRMLGLKALTKSIETETIYRSGNVPDLTGRLPPSEWYPANYIEWGDIIRKCIKRLGLLFNDPDERIKVAAFKIAADRGSALIRRGFLKEWIELAFQSKEESFELRKPFLDAITDFLTLGDEREEATKSELMKLEETLRGKTQSDQLKRIVGRRTQWVKTLSDLSDEEHNAFKDLAMIAIHDPSIIYTNIDWLFSDEAKSGYMFGMELGRLDDLDQWLTPLAARWTQMQGNDQFICGYFAGIKNRYGENWLEDQLDRWMVDADYYSLIGIITWRMLPTRRSASRLCNMLRESKLPGSYLGYLVYGFWARNLPLDDTLELIRAGAHDKRPEALFARLAFISQYLSTHKDDLERIEEEILQTLRDCTGLSFSVMGAFDWSQLADSLLPKRSLEIAEIIMKMISDPSEKYLLPPKEVMQVLGSCLRGGGWPVFEEIVGPALEQNRILGWRLEDPFEEGNILSNVDIPDLIKWIAKAIKTRLPIVAQFAITRGVPLPELTRALIKQWGNQEDLINTLHARFFTGAWSGSATAYWKGKLVEVQAWMKDENPGVRHWANDLSNTLEEMIKREAVREEEEGF